jgi:transposase
MADIWVGVDWGHEEHQFCVIDAERKVLLEQRVRHSTEGVRAMVTSLLSFGSAERIAVAIEAPRGAVVDALLDRGIDVYAINPKQLDRFRDRHNVAGAKDDRRDAYVLATSLATDGQCFRQVSVQDPRLVQLRVLERLHEELLAERTALGSRLREQLLRFYPQLLELGDLYQDAWIWELLELAPEPTIAQHLSPQLVERILKKHRIRRLSVDDVLDVLRSDAMVVAPGVTTAAVRYITAVLPRLRILHDQLKDVIADMKHLLDELEDGELPRTPEHKVEPRDVHVVRSLPGVGTYVGATLLAEASSALQARDYHALRAQAGVAPVTKATGKRSGPFAQVLMRRACNQRLRNAVHYWALSAITLDPRSKALYARLRAKGHQHARALRSVADRMLAVLVSMLQSGTTYDPQRRQVPVD